MEFLALPRCGKGGGGMGRTEDPLSAGWETGLWLCLLGSFSPCVSQGRIDQVLKMLARLREMKSKSMLSFLTHKEHQK